MNAPEHLAWLALLPLLWWLQRPPRPRRALLTAHFTQWQRARERLRRRPIRFDVLRFLLLVVAFAAAIVAATGATLPGRPGATSLVVLLDDSASLTADDGAPWRDAVARVRDTLQALPPHVSAALVRTGDDGLTVHAGTADELLAAVPAAPDGRRTLDLEAVAARLAGDPSADSRIAVWTITDGLGDAVPPRTGALSIVGAERHNVGIVGIAVADGWPLRDVAIDVRIANHGPARSVRITATGGVVATPPRELALSADGDASLRLELQRTDGGTVTVALTDAADAFPRDDTVRIELPPRTETNVGLLADVEAGPWARAAAETLADELNGRVVDAAERAGFLVVDGGIFVPPADAVPRLTFGTRDRQAP